MIYTNILAICEARNIPIRTVERETGIGNGTIRRWDEASPRVCTVKAVADYLGVTVDELIREPEGIKKAASLGDRRRKKAR